MIELYLNRAYCLTFSGKSVAKKRVQKIFFIQLPRFLNIYNMQIYNSICEELQLARIQRITICRFTKSCNWKSRKIFFQSFKYVLRTVASLICRLTSLRALFIWTSRNVTSIVSITHTVIFSKQEVLRRWAARGSPGEDKCS